MCPGWGWGVLMLLPVTEREGELAGLAELEGHLK